MKLHGNVRSGGGDKEVSLSKYGDLFIAKHLPDYASLVLAGKMWKVQDLTTTAALNNVLPTTTSGLTVQNPPGSGKTYAVFAITSIADVFEATLLGTYSLSHCAHRANVALYTRDVALTAIGGYKAGQGSYNGMVILDRGATVVDEGWTPIGDTQKSILNAQTWNSSYIPLEIPVIIPEGMHYSIGATGDTVTIEVGLGLVWAEFDEADLS